MLEGQDKSIEDVKKILATQRNYFYSNYGTDLNQFIGSNKGVDQTKQTIAQLVTNSLVYLTFLQGEQSKYQTLDAGETIQKIVQVAVTYLGDISLEQAALTSFKIDITIQNALGANIAISSTIQLG